MRGVICYSYDSSCPLRDIPSVLAMVIIAIASMGRIHISNIPLVKFPVAPLVKANGRGPMAEAVIMTMVAVPCIRPSFYLPYISAQITLVTILPAPLLAPNIIEYIRGIKEDSSVLMVARANSSIDIDT